MGSRFLALKQRDRSLPPRHSSLQSCKHPGKTGSFDSFEKCILLVPVSRWIEVIPPQHTELHSCIYPHKIKCLSPIYLLNRWQNIDYDSAIYLPSRKHWLSEVEIPFPHSSVALRVFPCRCKTYLCLATLTWIEGKHLGAGQVFGLMFRLRSEHHQSTLWLTALAAVPWPCHPQGCVMVGQGLLP